MSIGSFLSTGWSLTVGQSGYGHTNGHKTTPEQLQAVFDGLITNGLVTHTRALTGYIPGAEALKVVAKQISDMREQNPDLIYVLDREPKLKPQAEANGCSYLV